MSVQDKNFLGLDGFVWWFGVVESRQDPLTLGRVQVRIYGWHNESLAEIPSQNLPWAHIVHAVNDRAFATPREADTVFGFFADGRSGQIPVVLGVVPGYFTAPPNTGVGFHDLRSQDDLKQAPRKPASRTYNTDGSGITVKEAVSAALHPNSDELGKDSITGVASYENLANTVIQARKDNLDEDVITARGIQWSEPYPAYNPLYPYNQATETESGHVFELDDTPGSERIHIAHRSGTYVEWFPTGTKVEKITKSNYQIVMGDDHLHIMGKCMITVDGDAFIRVKGDIAVESGGSMSANVAGDLEFLLVVGSTSRQGASTSRLQQQLLATRRSQDLPTSMEAPTSKVAPSTSRAARRLSVAVRLTSTARFCSMVSLPSTRVQEVPAEHRQVVQPVYRVLSARYRRTLANLHQKSYRFLSATPFHSIHIPHRLISSSSTLFQTLTVIWLHLTRLPLAHRPVTTVHATSIPVNTHSSQTAAHGRCLQTASHSSRVRKVLPRSSHLMSSQHTQILRVRATHMQSVTVHRDQRLVKSSLPVPRSRALRQSSIYSVRSTTSSCLRYVNKYLLA